MAEDNDRTRRRFVGSAAMMFAAERMRMLDSLIGRAARADARAGVVSELDSLSRANGWVNSSPLTARELHGKVVLVQFWTFTCINWLRTLPYIRAWADRYRASGLVVIGAHAPEFPFERNADNVRRATGALNVTYPVAIDTDYAIWNAFKNQYWPALYLLDSAGRIQQHQFGEGRYAEIEREIQKMLIDAGAKRVDRQITPVEGRGIEAAADWSDLKTPETYVGYDRGAESFAAPADAAPDRSHVYALPRTLRANTWALAGDWTIRSGAIALNQPNGRLAFRFHARDLHLVMGSPASGHPLRFRVRLDGQPAVAAHGADVDDHGNGVANGQRVYQLIRQPSSIVDRVFEIEFLDRGVEAFCFTFG